MYVYISLFTFFEGGWLYGGKIIQYLGKDGVCLQFDIQVTLYIQVPLTLSEKIVLKCLKYLNNNMA